MKRWRRRVVCEEVERRKARSEEKESEKEVYV